jgi:hypothetical protein
MSASEKTRSHSPSSDNPMAASRKRHDCYTAAFLRERPVNRIWVHPASVPASCHRYARNCRPPAMPVAPILSGAWAFALQERHVNRKARCFCCIDTGLPQIVSESGCDRGLNLGSEFEGRKLWNRAGRSEKSDGRHIGGGHVARRVVMFITRVCNLVVSRYCRPAPAAFYSLTE